MKNFQKHFSIICVLAIFFVYFSLVLTAFGADTTTSPVSAGVSGSSSAQYTPVSSYTSKFQPKFLPKIVIDSKTPGELIINLYKYSIGIIGVIALGAITYGGILRVTSQGNPGKIAEGNGWITGSILGIALLLGAGLLLRTVDPNIIDISAKDSIIGSSIKSPGGEDSYWKKFLDGLTSGSEGIFTDEMYKQANNNYGVQHGESSIRNKLGIELNGEGTDGFKSKPVCQSGQNTGCVQFDGIRKDTVNELKALKDAGVRLRISSVVDGENHAQSPGGHYDGYKFDLSAGVGDVDKYIEKNFKQISSVRDYANVDGKNRPDLIRYQNPTSGAIYMYEPSATFKDKTGKTIQRVAHWDVYVPPKS